MSYSSFNSSATSFAFDSSFSSACSPSSPSSSSSSSSSLRRRVAFSDVEIIELPITVGDGPSVGVPLTVDWQAQDRNTFPLDFFEQFRPQRRVRDHLRINPETREKALLRNGVSEGEIMLGMNRARTLREERLDTVQQLRYMHISNNDNEDTNNDIRRRSLQK